MKEGKFWTDAHTWALVLGLLTAVFCLFVADGLFGLSVYSEEQYFRYALPGRIIYYVSLLGLPILFRKKMTWRETWVDLGLYLVLYYPLCLAVEGLSFHRAHKYLVTGSAMLSLPGEELLGAAVTALTLWAWQLGVFLALVGLEKIKASGYVSREMRDIILAGLAIAVMSFGVGDGIFGLGTRVGKCFFFLSPLILPVFFHKRIRRWKTFILFPVIYAFLQPIELFFGLLPVPFNEETSFLWPIRSLQDFSAGGLVDLLACFFLWFLVWLSYYFLTPHGGPKKTAPSKEGTPDKDIAITGQEPSPSLPGSPPADLP